MSIRTKSSELSLFNYEKHLFYEIISLNLQRLTAPLVSVRKMMIVKLPPKTTSWRTKIQVNGINKKLKVQFKLK